jgi:hypothetical protein
MTIFLLPIHLTTWIYPRNSSVRWKIEFSIEWLCFRLTMGISRHKTGIPGTKREYPGNERAFPTRNGNIPVINGIPAMQQEYSANNRECPFCREVFLFRAGNARSVAGCSRFVAGYSHR